MTIPWTEAQLREAEHRLRVAGFVARPTTLEIVGVIALLTLGVLAVALLPSLVR